jgi:CelD/BcsL family acetyltransferase involved in cellulose biosynthesis
MQSSRLVDLDHDLTGTAFERATITVYPSVPEAESAWRHAVDHCACFLFQTFEWHSAWRDTVGRTVRVSEHVVHVADADGRTLLILPLGICRRGPLRVLEFLGGSLTDYNAPLIDREFARVVEVFDIRRLWQTVQRLLPKVDAVWLARMPQTIDGVRNPMIELSRVRHTDTAHAAMLPASFKEFTAARSIQFFAQIRRHQRRLQRRGTIDICFPAESEQRIEVLRTLARQKSRWLRRNGLADEFRRPALQEFYERLTTCQVQGGNILVACLRVGDQVAAALWGAVFGRRYYFLLPSYAEEWRKFSAARILTQSVVQRCIAQGDVRVFDLTIGNERYTHTWTDHSLALHEYLEARTVAGATFVGWRRLRNAIRGNQRSRGLARAFASRLRLLWQRPMLRNEAGA